MNEQETKSIYLKYDQVAEQLETIESLIVELSGANAERLKRNKEALQVVARLLKVLDTQERRRKRIIKTLKANDLLMEEYYNEVAPGGTVADFKKIIKQARATVKAYENEEKKKTLSLSRVMTVTASKPIEWHKIGQKEKLPFAKLLEDYTNQEELPAPTELTATKIFNGLAIIRNQYPDTQPNTEGNYVYRLSMRQLAEMCDLPTNGKSIKLITSTLRLLSGVRICADTGAGKLDGAISYKSYTPHGQPISGVTQISIPREFLDGVPIYMNEEEYELMKPTDKGIASARFCNQIKIAGNKSETKLIEEIFGYKPLLYFDGEDKTDKGRECIRKHHARNKKKLLEMFEKEAEKGTIGYTLETNQRGENIYRWERLLRPGKRDQSKTLKLPLPEGEN